MIKILLFTFLIFLDVCSLYILKYTFIYLLSGILWYTAYSIDYGVFIIPISLLYSLGYVVIVFLCFYFFIQGIKKNKSIKQQILVLILPLLFLVPFLIGNYLYLRADFLRIIKSDYTPSVMDYVCDSKRFVRVSITTASRGDMPAHPSPYNEWRYVRAYDDHHRYQFYLSIVGDVDSYYNYTDIKKALVDDGVDIKQCKNSAGELVPNDETPLAEDYVCNPELFFSYKDIGLPEFAFYEVHMFQSAKPLIKVYKTYQDLKAGLQSVNHIDINTCKSKVKQTLNPIKEVAL